MKLFSVALFLICLSITSNLFILSGFAEEAGVRKDLRLQQQEERVHQKSGKNLTVMTETGYGDMIIGAFVAAKNLIGVIIGIPIAVYRIGVMAGLPAAYAAAIQVPVDLVMLIGTAEFLRGTRFT